MTFNFVTKKPLSRGHMEFMNFGKRYWDVDLLKLTPRQLEEISPYLQRLEQNLSDGVGVVLSGLNGVGKTYLAALLTKCAWQFCDFPGLLVSADELKDAWIEDYIIGSDGETLLQRVSRMPFLVVDDIGKEHRTASGFSESKFGSLLRKRVRDKKVTVLTTNLNEDEFRNVYGGSIAGLVKESCVWIELFGQDMREVLNKTLKDEYSAQVVSTTGGLK